MMMKNSPYFDMQIDQAVDGLEWAKKINTWEYDVVFLDYNMPVMNGIDCLKAIHIPHKPNIIMVTAVWKHNQDGENVLNMAYENEVYNYISN